MSSEKANGTFYLYRDTEQFFNYIYFALFFLVILIIALSVYYWKIAQTYLLDEKTISISGSLLELGEIEQKINLGESGYLDFDKMKETYKTNVSIYGNKIFIILILLYIFLIFSFNRIRNE